MLSAAPKRDRRQGKKDGFDGFTTTLLVSPGRSMICCNNWVVGEKEGILFFILIGERVSVKEEAG